MVKNLSACLLTLSLLTPRLSFAAAPHDDSEAWRQEPAVEGILTPEVDLNVRFPQDGYWIDVDDAALEIHVTGRPGTNGSLVFSGRAGSATTFEARPLSNTRPVEGYTFESAAVRARVVWFGDELTIDGRAGGRPLSLTIRRTTMPDSYRIESRDGTRLDAWIPPAFARVTGRFDQSKLSREGLSVLGAAIALMFRKS